MVGLTLQAKADGSYLIVAVSDQTSKEVMGRIQPNDKLIRVDGLEVANQPVGKVIDSLRVRVGEVRWLLVERDGTRHRTAAKVVRIL